MTDKKENKTPKRRTQVKELPKEEKQVSKDEQKQVKGGMHNIMDSILDNFPKR